MKRASSGFVALMAMVGACGSDCVAATCPLGIAVRINVSAASGVPLSGVFVTVNNIVDTSCAADSTATDCVVNGGGGHYDLQIGATGFQTVTRTADVSVREPSTNCDCGAVETVTLNVQLSPQP